MQYGHLENAELRAENKRLIDENMSHMEHFENATCLRCGSPLVIPDVSVEDHQLRAENVRLREEVTQIDHTKSSLHFKYCSFLFFWEFIMPRFLFICFMYLDRSFVGNSSTIHWQARYIFGQYSLLNSHMIHECCCWMDGVGHLSLLNGIFSSFYFLDKFIIYVFNVKFLNLTVNFIIKFLESYKFYFSQTQSDCAGNAVLNDEV